MSTQRTPVLSVHGLTVRAGNGPRARDVVQDVSFHVHSGETLCLVGESGSGKSVSSYSVMGLLPPGALTPVAGRVLVDGEDVLTASHERLRELRATRMAMVFQEPMTALNPVMRVGMQIDEVLREHGRMGKAERRARVLEMLRAVHLPEPERIIDSYPHQLSGGQRQRIVIAMALILKPRLLIADEPTTALDVTTQKQILLLMRELQREQGTAMLFVTHDFGVVSDIADRIVVMNGGRVVESGTRDEILTRPSVPYTRMLVSSVPSLIPRQGEAPAGEIVLEVAGVSKTFGEKSMFRKARHVHAAKDISLTLRRGEILGVVGESGSGKSTIARCIVRLLDPSAGVIRVKGNDIATLDSAALRPVRRRIQIVFQDPYRSLNPRMRVGESVIEGLLNAGVARALALARAAELFRLVGLPDDALDRYPHQFSGGQRQRICIARALALEPDILVADEAVSALDVSVQAQVLELLEEIRRKTGVAVLFITHDLRVAAQVCDTIVVMRNGEIVERGPAARVLTSPREAYTRDLIDAAPGRDWDFHNFRPVFEAEPVAAVA